MGAKEDHAVRVKPVHQNLDSLANVGIGDHGRPRIHCEKATAASERLSRPVLVACGGAGPDCHQAQLELVAEPVEVGGDEMRHGVFLTPTRKRS